MQKIPIPANSTAVNVADPAVTFDTTTPPINKPPVVTATASSPTLPDGKILLNATATDVDGTVTKYQWTSIDGLVIDDVTKASTFATAIVPGSFRFQVQATDDDGATSSSVQVISTVTDSADTTPPTANAGQDKSITLPTSSVTLDGSGSDLQGPVTYKWEKVSGSGTLVNPTSAIASVTGLTQGVSVFRLTVTDKAGNTKTDDVNVTVNAANVPGQSFPLSFSPLTADYTRPFAGCEIWVGNQWLVNIPNVTKLDEYDRFGGGQLEPTLGSYNFNPIGDKIKVCIDRGAKFSFGIMTYFPGAQVGYKEAIKWSDGSAGLYPEGLHTKMQASSFKDAKKGNTWCPNWNSPDYQTWWANLHIKIYAWLNSTTYKGILYKDAINYIDIRGFGQYGEWHMYQDSQPFTETEASLTAIIKGVRDNIPDIQLVALSDAFLPGNNQKVTANVSYLLLTGKNLKGEFGWRKDHVGSDNFPNEAFKYEGISTVVNGQKLGDLVANKWKVAPIVGEPSQSSTYNNMVADCTRYHFNSFGNGNYGSKIDSNIVNANKVIGGRFGLASGTLTTNTGALGVVLNWNNAGNVPAYEDFDITFELRQGSTVVRSLKSGLNLRTFLPGSKQTTDNFGSLPSGTYDLYLVVKNPSGFRNLPLNIQGNKSGYLLKSGIVL